MLSGSNPSIVVGPDIAQRAGGHTNLLLIACLAVLTGAKLHLITGLPNTCGGFTFGRDFPGTDVHGKQGLGIMEMFDAAASGEIRALYIMGENVFLSLPDAGRLKKAISGLELVIVQDSFLNETTEFAHVVLPCLSWAERSGTYTNMEGRTQYLRKALDANGREDWRIVTEVSRHLGYEMNYSEEKDIFSRMAHIAPCFRDLSFGNLGAGSGGRRNAVWPENANLEEATEISFSAKDFETQRGRSGTVLAAIEYPLRGWGNLERSSSALRSIAFNQYARIGTELASLLSISEGDRVSLSSHVGEVELEARIDVGVPAETVMLPLFSIPELLEWRMNPVTRTPILDTTEIEVRKAF